MEKILQNINKLRDITEKLNTLIKVEAGPVPLTANYSLQYDYFMEFIHLYEDTDALIQQLVVTDDNILEIKRAIRDLQNFWNKYTIDLTYH